MSAQPKTQIVRRSNNKRLQDGPVRVNLYLPAREAAALDFLTRAGVDKTKIIAEAIFSQAKRAGYSAGSSSKSEPSTRTGGDGPTV